MQAYTHENDSSRQKHLSVQVFSKQQRGQRNTEYRDQERDE